MGYTHYFKFKNSAKIDAERWNKALELGEACAKESGVEIAGWDGTGEPLFTGCEISFNGKGYEMSHETFYLEREGRHTHGFCKTARKPYDIVVCCFLLAFKKVFGKDFSYSSDGVTRGDLRRKENKEYWATHCPEWKPQVEKEWGAAYKLFNKVYSKMHV